MSVKSAGRRIGRMIRRITGLPLPITMKIGKMIAQGQPEYDIEKKFPDILSRENYECGDGCCSYPIFTIKGPKGSLEENYGLGERGITKEYNVTMALRKVPMGTAVTINKDGSVTVR